jgi:hypothetical protein
MKYKSLLLAIVIFAAALLPLFQAQPARADTTLFNGLVAYWPLDEQASWRLDSVDSHVLTDHNSVSSELTPPDGDALIGRAANFSAASSQYLSVADNADLSASGSDLGDMTFSAWVRLSDKSTYRYIISKSAVTEYYIDYNPSQDRFRFGWGTPYVWADALGSPSINTWYFIVGWYDSVGNTINISVNGLSDSAVPVGFDPSGNGDFLIGFQGDLGYYMDGLIDEVGVWRRMLTSDERAELYNGGAGNAYPFGDLVPPVQDDLSWIEDGTFDIASSDPSTPWDWERALRRTSGASANLLSGVNAFCGNTMAEVRPNYEKFYPNESPGDYYHITGDPPVWNPISSLHQRFFWPGGAAYFQARFMPSIVTGASVRVIIVRVENIIGPPLTRQPVDGFVFDTSLPTWHLAQSTFYLSPGWYDIDFFETGYEDQLVSDYPVPEDDDQAAYLVDDVTLSLNAYTTYCTVEGGPTRTPFPTSTRTPTPTPTLTPTSGASPTPSATATGNPAAFGNCSFESGSSNWTGSGFSVQLSGGPVGPQYGQTTNTLKQIFAWPGGYAYFTFWVGPNSNGTVRVRNTSSQSSVTLASVASPSTWQLRTYAAQMVAGNYAFEAVALNGSVMKIDGAMVSSNTYYYCGSGSSPATPTSGPTSYVTPTATRTSQYTNTPTRTPTPTPSRTPFATGTAQPTNTPRPTNTQPNTNTPQATDTQSAPQQTATAQGTDVPTLTPYPTFTPYPTYTPYPSATPYDAPPEQPEPNFYADCIRPQNADPGAWTEYTTCYALSWFAWSDINTNEIANFSATAQAKEPFGTINEVGSTMGDFRDLWNSYDWNDTGITGTDEEASTGTFDQPASGILLGQLDLNNTPNPYTLVCNLRLDDVMGPNVTVAVCFVWGMLKATGFLTWLQLLWDLLMVWLLIRYVQKAWVAKATQG